MTLKEGLKGRRTVVENRGHGAQDFWTEQNFCRFNDLHYWLSFGLRLQISEMKRMIELGGRLYNFSSCICGGKKSNLFFFRVLCMLEII
jgi:hypothetical protein